VWAVGGQDRDQWLSNISTDGPPNCTTRGLVT
jgi:hypothetical protein